MDGEAPIERDAKRASIERRLLLLKELSENPRARAIEMERCRRSPIHWFNHWVWTYDPRLAEEGKPAHVPMDLFPRQVQAVQWLEARERAKEDGLFEKSRDIGFTWFAGGYALHRWLFVGGYKTTFGSRKEEYVDRLGDPDSIFEKIRMVLRSLPWWMLPAGFREGDHLAYMRLMNPANGNLIRGEAGDQMGRGGRSTLYVIDEAAFLEHGDKVDAATSANSEVRVWASTVNGMGNTFARKRFSGALRPDQIFRFHWRDDPRKTEEWAARKRLTLEEHVWASEYEIDYTASVEGICILAKWVESSVRLGELLRTRGTAPVPDTWGKGGLDVGAGKAKSVLVVRYGPVVQVPASRRDPDTTETALWALDLAQASSFRRADGFDCTVKTLCFDSPGVGAGVQSTLSHHERSGLTTCAINTGVEPSETMWPDGQTSQEKFANLKAELWFLARERFKAAHELLLWLENDGQKGQNHPVGETIVLPSLDSGPEVQALASQVSLVRWFRNEKGKILIEKKDQLAQRGIASPDHADALVLTFAATDQVELWARLAKS